MLFIGVCTYFSYLQVVNKRTIPQLEIETIISEKYAFASSYSQVILISIYIIQWSRQNDVKSILTVNVLKKCRAVVIGALIIA